MKDYLEKSLHLKVNINEINALFEKLPLVFKGRYNVYSVEINSLTWIAMCPKMELKLVTLRKDHAMIKKVSGLECALILDSASAYMKEKLLDEGIPFVIMQKQIYLPFIGVLFTEKNKYIEPVDMISFLTQRLILTAIYEKWVDVTVTEAGKRLDVTKTSAKRSFDEIEYMNIGILGMKGKSRVITIPDDIKNLWNEIKDKLRSPVVARFELNEDIGLEKKGGISALCEYSMLSDNKYPTYAVTKKEISETGIKSMKKAFRGLDPGCVVLELGYYIESEDRMAQDPLSVFLSITDAEKKDERISTSLNEMLEDYVW